MKRLALLLLLAACKKQAPPLADAHLPASECMTPDRALIAVMTNPEGYLEPCGCTTNPLGGIPKLAALWAEQKKCQKDPLLITTGNFLFDTGKRSPTNKEQDETRARLISDIYVQMGAFAQMPGPFDKGFLHEVKTPWLEGGQVRRAKTAGLDVQLVGVEEGSTLPVLDKADVTIALSTLSDAKNRALKGFDIIVATGNPEPRSPALAGHTLILDAGTQGQYVGLLELVQGEAADHWRFFDGGAAELTQSRKQLGAIEREVAGMDPKAAQRQMQLDRRDNLAKQITALETSPPAAPTQKHFRFSLVPLTKKMPDAPEVKKQVAAYNAQLCDLSQRATEHRPCPEPVPGAPTYVGSETCGTCHQAAYKQWQTQRHAHAVKTLEDAGKYCDLSCIGCHTTGFNQAGGFCSPQKAGALKEVGCEMCHGAGSLHQKDKAKITRAPGEATCLQCHTKEHSDQFEFNAYRARILGPGHGQ